MDVEKLRAFCKSLPHTTEDVKWGDHLCFLIGGKMYAITKLEKSETVLTFKCTPQKFEELVERNGIIPAPYMAAKMWVGLEKWSALRDSEIRDCVRESYNLVFARLTKKLQKQLAQ